MKTQKNISEMSLFQGSIIVTNSSRRKGGYFSYTDSTYTGFFAVASNGDIFQLQANKEDDICTSFLYGKQKQNKKESLTAAKLSTIQNYFRKIIAERNKRINAALELIAEVEKVEVALKGDFKKQMKLIREKLNISTNLVKGYIS